MKYRYEELARMIDHALLHPTMTDAEVKEGCRLADRYGVATVCVKPYHVPLACQILQNSAVQVSCVIGFPAGNSATETKVAEARLACQQGVAEIDMVINIGKALSGDFDYVENEIRAICDEAHSFGVKVKTIFETASTAQTTSKSKPPAASATSTASSASVISAAPASVPAPPPPSLTTTNVARTRNQAHPPLRLPRLGEAATRAF